MIFIEYVRKSFGSVSRRRIPGSHEWKLKLSLEAFFLYFELGDPVQALKFLSTQWIDHSVNHYFNHPLLLYYKGAGNFWFLQTYCQEARKKFQEDTTFSREVGLESLLKIFEIYEFLKTQPEDLEWNPFETPKKETVNSTGKRKRDGSKNKQLSKKPRLQPQLQSLSQFQPQSQPLSQPWSQLQILGGEPWTEQGDQDPRAWQVVGQALVKKHGQQTTPPPTYQGNKQFLSDPLDYFFQSYSPLPEQLPQQPPSQPPPEQKKTGKRSDSYSASVLFKLVSQTIPKNKHVMRLTNQYIIRHTYLSLLLTDRNSENISTAHKILSHFVQNNKSDPAGHSNPLPIPPNLPDNSRPTSNLQSAFGPSPTHFLSSYSLDN
eukprot:TRINITY_DN9392_c0_g1_i5.p1 TRINITY_DN9392_c0_g1~~TRINITY_DN9392_c0_g1_i5.p1  ORF type:complete len:375 (-),score=72.77 TRINITY_DN9392_c0_g1_i5:1109-2233(-)